MISAMPTNSPKASDAGGLDISGLEQIATAQVPKAQKITPEAMGLVKPKSKIPTFIIYIIIGVVVLAAAGGGAFYYLSNYSPQDVSFSVSPASAEVKVDGTLLLATTLKLKPGAYTISATAPDYFPQSNSFQVKGRTQNNVSVSLLPMPKIQKVSDELVSFPSLFTDGKAAKGLVYLTKSGNELRRLDFGTGAAESMSTTTWAMIQNIIWSSDQSLVVARVKNDIKTLTDAGSPMLNTSAPDGATIGWIYNFARTNLLSQTLMPLYMKVLDAKFSAAGDKLVYVVGIDKSTLNTSDLDGKNFSVLTSLETQLSAAKITGLDLIIAVGPDDKKITIAANSGDKNFGLWLFDKVSGDLRQVGNSLNSINVKFSYSGKKFIFEDSAGGTNTIKLATIGSQAETTVTDLGFYTEISKVTWLDENTLLYAIKSDGADDLYKFNLQTKKSTSLAYATPEEPLLISDLFVPLNIPTITSVTDSTKKQASIGIKAIGNEVYFISNNKLYKVEIKDAPAGMAKKTPAKTTAPKTVTPTAETPAATTPADTTATPATPTAPDTTTPAAPSPTAGQ